MRDLEKHRAATLAWRSAHPGRMRETQRKWWAAHPGYRNAKMHEWRAVNPERAKAIDNKSKASHRDTAKVWRQANPGYMKKWFKERRAIDPQYRIQNSVRARIWQALKGRTKKDSFVALLGCTVAETVAHLEGQFTDGMTWATYGCCGWHIDHIVPMSAFDLTDPVQLAHACHFTNLQPLWWRDNLTKSARRA